MRSRSLLALATSVGMVVAACSSGATPSPSAPTSAPSVAPSTAVESSAPPSVEPSSNLLRGDVARSIVGRPGTFTVRPEKIRMAEPSDPVGPDETSALGHIRSVVYLGPDTRFVVALDAGSELVVTQQNLATSSMDALALDGKAVQLIWKQQHNFAIESPGGGEP